jgi:HAMP domain-containing protein
MDYITHWLLTAAGAFLLLICGFASQFLRARRTRGEPR